MISKIKQWFALVIIFIFNKLPIKHNKIMFFSYYGAQFGCNPKYISNYIIHHYPKDTFDVVWAFNDPDSKGINSQCRKVKTMSMRYFYELCTAKIIITNYRTTDLFVKREEQYYIQTWHSSLRLKQIEQDAEEGLPPSYIEMAKKDSLKCDLLLSGCQFSTVIFEKAFWYKGEIFEYGTPRNDILLNSSLITENTLKKLNIPQETKVVLYAPTFRKENNLRVYDLDYERLIKTLTNKFGGKWVVLMKLHPHHISEASGFATGDHVINVTDFDDIQELLVTADILISDYSSLIFDFAITCRPCFLYVPDLDVYTTNERKLYFDLNELPFISATSNNNLLKKIERFSASEYKVAVAAFLKEVGTYEQGKACEYLLKRMEIVCFQEERNEINEAV